MPQALIDKIEKASTFNQGFATAEYLSSAMVDMVLHMDPNGVVDPDKFEREALAKIGMPKELVMRHRLPQFNHLFSSDAYSAGYYSYLWSETMDADTWAAFEEAGNPFDKATADRFRADPALDRQRDRPRRSLSRVPRPRSGRQGADEEEGISRRAELASPWRRWREGDPVAVDR